MDLATVRLVPVLGCLIMGTTALARNWASESRYSGSCNYRQKMTITCSRLVRSWKHNSRHCSASFSWQ